MRGCPSGKFNHVLDADGSDQLARGAEGDYFAVVHDGDAVAEALGFVHVVGRKDDGAAVELELVDQIPKLAAGLRVEAGGGLVEEQKIGIADQGAGQREALLLAAGKGSDAGVLFFVELRPGR